MADTLTVWDGIITSLMGIFTVGNITLDAFCALMIMSCFLGKYVKLTRKGVLLMSALFVLNAIYNTVSIFLRLLLSPGSLSYGRTIDITKLIYLYFFVVFFILYQTKRFWRALEGTVVLYCFQQYLQGVLLNVFGLIDGNPLLVINQLRDVSSVRSQLYYPCLFFVSLAVYLVFYFGFYKKGLFLRLKVREMVLLVAWIFVMEFVLGLSTGENGYEVKTVLLATFIPLLSVFLPIFLLMNRYRNFLRDKNVYQQTYLDAELEYVEQYKKAQTQTRAFRHDVINQLSFLSMLMHEGKTEQAKEQLDQMLGEVRDLSPKFVTGDQMLDCIVAMKAAKMEELGIPFTADGVADGGLNMKPMDVCGIFANALDNAIEAQERLEKASDRWIRFEIRRTGKFFVLRISNATDRKAKVERLFEGGYTSKKDAEYHGFGLHNIQNAVERYDGLLKVEAEEKRFTLAIMIPRSEKSKED